MPEPVYSRYTACANLAGNYFQLGRIDEGLVYAKRALAELVPEFREQDPYGGGTPASQSRAAACRRRASSTRPGRTWMRRSLLAERCDAERAQIAADITRASYEVAVGRSDVALTRLDQVLARARELPPVLRDTLVCVIRAEEAAGNTARALMRLEELSDHIYDLAIERVRSQVELSSLREQSGLDLRSEQDRARLISKLEPRSAPESWKTLQRLSVSAVMRMDESGLARQARGRPDEGARRGHGHAAPCRPSRSGSPRSCTTSACSRCPRRSSPSRARSTSSERAIVQRHAEAGARDAARRSATRWFSSPGRSPSYHHAHWDGTRLP